MSDRRKPLLCRLGWHTSKFLDGALCHGSTRCNRCLAWENPSRGRRVENCRRYADAHGMHAPLACEPTRHTPPPQCSGYAENERGVWACQKDEGHDGEHEFWRGGP